MHQHLVSPTARATASGGSTVKLTIVPPDELDLDSAPALIEQLEEVAGSNVDLDCSGIAFIDSSGMRALVELHERWASDGCAFVLVKPSTTLRRLLELTQLEDTFVIRE